MFTPYLTSNASLEIPSYSSTELFKSKNDELKMAYCLGSLCSSTKLETLVWYVANPFKGTRWEHTKDLLFDLIATKLAFPEIYDYEEVKVTDLPELVKHWGDPYSTFKVRDIFLNQKELMEFTIPVNAMSNERILAIAGILRNLSWWPHKGVALFDIKNKYPDLDTEAALFVASIISNVDISHSIYNIGPYHQLSKVTLHLKQVVLQEEGKEVSLLKKASRNSMQSMVFSCEGTSANKDQTKEHGSKEAYVDFLLEKVVKCS